MIDLMGKRVVLDLGDSFDDRVKMRNALFQTGDSGTVIAPHRRIDNAWIVVMHERAVLFFTDELREYDDVICKSCKHQADDPQRPGCGSPCGLAGCLCQHRAEHPGADDGIKAPTECAS